MNNDPATEQEVPCQEVEETTSSQHDVFDSGLANGQADHQSFTSDDSDSEEEKEVSEDQSIETPPEAIPLNLVLLRKTKHLVDPIGEPSRRRLNRNDSFVQYGSSGRTPIRLLYPLRVGLKIFINTINNILKDEDIIRDHVLRISDNISRIEHLTPTFGPVRQPYSRSKQVLYSFIKNQYFKLANLFEITNYNQRRNSHFDQDVALLEFCANAIVDPALIDYIMKCDCPRHQGSYIKTASFLSPESSDILEAIHFNYDLSKMECCFKNIKEIQNITISNTVTI